MHRKEIIEALNDKELSRLYDLFLKLRNQLGEAFKSEYNRSLPLADLLLDRWDRARENGFGQGASIYDSCLLFGEVKVGEGTWVGPNTILDGSGGLKIGSYCSISAGVQIYSHDSVNWALTGGKAPYEYAPTEIGNNCYLGPNVIIAKGVSLGEGCIVGANSFVNRSFESGSRIAGSPAKII